MFVKCSECRRSCSELGYRLFHEQFRRFGLWQDVNVSTSFGVNGVRFCLTEIVTMPSASTLVFVCECLFRFLTDIAAMPEFSHKILPPFALVPEDWD